MEGWILIQFDSFKFVLCLNHRVQLYTLQKPPSTQLINAEHLCAGNLNVNNWPEIWDSCHSLCKLIFLLWLCNAVAGVISETLGNWFELVRFGYNYLIGIVCLAIKWYEEQLDFVAKWNLWARLSKSHKGDACGKWYHICHKICCF